LRQLEFLEPSLTVILQILQLGKMMVKKYGHLVIKAFKDF